MHQNTEKAILQELRRIADALEATAYPDVVVVGDAFDWVPEDDDAPEGDDGAERSGEPVDEDGVNLVTGQVSVDLGGQLDG